MLNKRHKCASLPDKAEKSQKKCLIVRLKAIILSLIRGDTFRMLDRRRKIKVTPKDEVEDPVIMLDIKQIRMLKAIAREKGIPAKVLFLDALARYAKGKSK